VQKQSQNSSHGASADNALLGLCAPSGYFLRADSGPKFLVSGCVVRPLATRKESEGKFLVFYVEGAKAYAGRGFEGISLRFSETHHALQVVNGVVEVVVEGTGYVLGRRRRYLCPLERRGVWLWRVSEQNGMFLQIEAVLEKL